MKKHIILLFAFFLLISFSYSQKKEKVLKKTFYFASASYELDSAEMSKAKKYFKLIDKFNLTKIEIYGFADSDGNSTSNLKLSQKRINTLTSLLEGRGYNTEQKKQAKGEENPAYNNDSEEKFKNRRVEVVAFYSSKKSSKKKKNTKKKVKEKPALVAAKKEKNIKVEDFKKGKTISLPLVQFYGGTANFLPGAEDILDEVIPNFKKKSNIKNRNCRTYLLWK